ncbi:dehydrogenase, FMN-dependent [delta proteobacterium NaphS2]|nr:dehydrogenase, FMN-dependent [delta proteobacterium NaphS2]
MVEWFCTICYQEQKTEKEIPESCVKCGAGSASIIPLAEQSRDASGVNLVGPFETLEQVRDRARTKLKGICAAYPHCNGDSDRICQREAYGKPIGLGGAGSGASFAANVTSLARLRLQTRLVGDHFDPDPSFLFFDLKLSVPIMGSSTAGISRYNDAMGEVDFCRATIRGCREMGALAWRGDTWFYTAENTPALDALESEGGYGVPIFKPRSQDVLKGLIERAEKAGCPATGVDLDGCGSTIMERNGQPVFRKSIKDLKALVAFTSLPFIAKGIMTPEDAEACVEAGVRVIAVSNHGGRVLDHTPGVAEVLPAIVDRVGENALITADGGVRTGYDVIKMLALGADAVLIGRDVIRAAVGGGSLGVRLQMERLRNTLKRAMKLTGCPDLSAITSDILYDS